jgi:hypothetical protein
MNTITLTPSTHPNGGHRSSRIAPHCWCGQDLEYVHAGHCPRCGTARAPLLPPLARAS